MIHGYHVILTMYGYWLPNDPRGSWSDFVGRWELLQFGRPIRTMDRKSLAELTQAERSRRDAAQKALLYPAVTLDDQQIDSVANGFAEVVRNNGYTIWACAFMPQHTHLVIARHTYKVEQIATLLKGAATRRISRDGLHPLKQFESDGKIPLMWASRCWKVYLDSDEAIERAIRYVENNPIEEGKPKQEWPFVTPFRGLEPGWITYH
jgi:REP element-mobilizing transposase RayT